MKGEIIIATPFEMVLIIRVRMKRIVLFLLTLCLLAGFAGCAGPVESAELTGPTLPGAMEVYPTVMVNDRLYEWHRGKAVNRVPSIEGSVYYGDLIETGGHTPHENGEFAALFSASGQIYTLPDDEDIVYIKISTDWMEGVFVKFSRCSEQTQSKTSENSTNESIVSNDFGFEECTFVYYSLDEMKEAIINPYITESDEHIDEQVHLKEIEYFYMPSEDSFPFYKLFQIEVLPEFIVFYYLPENDLRGYFQYDTGITVTFCRSNVYTIESLSSQSGIFPTQDGILYNEANGDLSFMVDTSLMTIHVPSQLNDFDTICSAFDIIKIEIK